MLFADVILPLPLENQYTYRIPADLESSIQVGSRVLVHFGKKRFYTAIVLYVHEKQPTTDYEIKEIYALLDPMPIVRRPQLQFWQWISNYYLCKLGDVYKAALPSGLKLESETIVSFNSDYEADAPLKPAEISVLDAFGTTEKMSISELEKKTGLRNVVSILTTLLSKGAISISEQIKKGFAAKKESYVRLTERYRQDENQLHQAFEQLKRAPKQEQLLISFLDLSHALHPTLSQEVSKKELLERSEGKVTILDQLVKRSILEYYEKEVSRIDRAVCKLRPIHELTRPQLLAYRSILDSFREKEICLLHGVTSSGKTEIYIHLIQNVLNSGRQVLYLLPEIAITTQITDRLSQIFGKKLLVYHSKFSDNERVEVWNRLLREKGPYIILGVRSALFLPFKDLGLIIIDEEHEVSYKQQDPAPRYNARNAAMVLASMHGGKTLLGSATPSIDSYFNARGQKYGLVELRERYESHISPNIVLVDTKEAKRKKQMKHPFFSPILLEQMQQTLLRGEQVILFQNRRGFAPMMECKECSYVPHCAHCDVSMTYHKRQHLLMCHYCGYTIRPPEVCPSCGGTTFQQYGFGTEKVEEEVANLFSEYPVARLDMDTAKNRSAYERILSDFERGKTRILIGTQMISKGLDFSNVTLVGILNADGLMNYPDFRAHERAFQLMMQVSGRTGRRDKPGTVILQTAQPEHPLIQMVQRSAYQEMVDWQLKERNMFHYPPYYRLIVIVLRSRNEGILQDLARMYAEKLRNPLGERVLGPVTPPVAYIQSLFIRKIVIKIEIQASIQSMRKLLEQIQEEMKQQPMFRQVIIHYDVDPL